METEKFCETCNGYGETPCGRGLCDDCGGSGKHREYRTAYLDNYELWWKPRPGYETLQTVAEVETPSGRVYWRAFSNPMSELDAWCILDHFKHDHYLYNWEPGDCPARGRVIAP